MLRSEIVTEVALMIGRTDGSLDTNIANWINWGLHYLDRVADFRGLRKRVKFPFVVGDHEYSFPSDLKYPKHLTMVDHLMEDITDSDIDLATGYITVSTNITTGTVLQFLNTDPPAPLSANTYYYAINVDSTTIQIATSSANATAGTAVTLTDKGTSPSMLEIFNGSDSRKLTYIHERSFVSSVPDIMERDDDKPSFYIDKGDVFGIDRPIDEALCGDLVYYKWQDDMDSDSDEPEVNKIEDIIILSAAVFAWRVLEEQQKLKDTKDELREALSQHIMVIERHPDEYLANEGFDHMRSNDMRANMVANAYKYPHIGRGFEEY